MKIEQSFAVEYSYQVHFTHNLFSLGNKTLAEVLGKKASNAIVFIDESVHDVFPCLKKDIQLWADQHPENISLKLPVHIVPGGEAVKNDFPIVEKLIKAMLDAAICRHSYVIIIGGGAVLDAVGFAAAIFHRGVKQIRIPTTILAQDDSGVGVKNAVNFLDTKNLLGTFAPPYAVVNDSLFISSLPQRDRLAGIAEAIKVALIKDRDFYDYLKANTRGIREGDLTVIEELIKRSACLHMDHICNNGDPFELGSSRPLDFGHWSAHRLELMTKHEVKHGEAVAIGICLDMLIAAAMEMVTYDVAYDVVNTFRDCGYSIWHGAMDEKDKKGHLKVLKGLTDFKEHLGGELTIPMPTAIGKMVDIHEMPSDLVIASLDKLRDLALV